MKAFLSASPCIFFENETLFHEGENSWAGREKSSHFSILKEKNTLSSPTLLRLFWNFVYVQISVFPLSPSWVRDSLLGKEGGINTYGGVGGRCLLSFFWRAEQTCEDDLLQVRLFIERMSYPFPNFLALLSQCLKILQAYLEFVLFIS